MADDSVLAGRPMLGGIVYDDFEDLTVLLGYGVDTFTVDTTHDGTTTIDAGRGDDTIHVRTVDGHTFLLGAEGDDTFRVGSVSGLLDLLAALLVLDGGAGNDIAYVDDSGDTNDNLGRLTQTSLDGLDMDGAHRPRRARPSARPHLLGDTAGRRHAVHDRAVADRRRHRHRHRRRDVRGRHHAPRTCGPRSSCCCSRRPRAPTRASR